MVKAKKSLSILVASALALSLGVLALPLASPAAADPGTHYYVNAATGLDTNPGTLALPWKTITHAVETGCPAGTSPADPNVIHVAAGTYDTSTNGETFPIDFDKNNVTLVGAGAGTTTVDGEDSIITTPTIFDINATGITIQDFTLEDADTAINADVGGFNILDNVFSNGTDYDIYHGVYVNISETDLDSNFSFDDILIDGNDFYITTDGVYINIDLDYDAAKTGLNATIGDIDIRENIFDMITTNGIDIRIYVNDLTSGSVSIGNIDIYLGNQFYDGNYGVHFDSALKNFIDTTVTVGDFSVNDNSFEDQCDAAIYIEEYYLAEYWYGTTTASFGKLEAIGNDIDSDETGCGGIFVNSYAHWRHFYDDVYVAAGNIYVEDNDSINVDGNGITVQYYYTEFLSDNTSINLGDLFIRYNDIVSTGGHGIYVDYYMGWYMEGHAGLTMGDTYVTNNAIDAAFSGLYLCPDYFGSYSNDDSTATFGDITVKGNDIDAQWGGMYLFYYCPGYDIDDATQVDMGAVYIGGIDAGEGNTINANWYAINIEYQYVADGMGEEDIPCKASLVMDDIYIQNNDLWATGDGIYIYYYDYIVGSYMYDDAYVELPDYIITGNTFNVTGNGIYLYTYENPYWIWDNSTIDFGGMLIDDNTFNGLAYDPSDPMDYGIYLDIEDLCYDTYDNSATILGDMTITDNRFYGLDLDGVYVDYYYIGYELYASSMLEIGDLVIADNLIDGARNGINVSYKTDYTYENSTLTMGNLDITDNNMSNITNDGVYLYYYLSAYNSSTQTIGRALIQDNILDPVGARDGIYVYMTITESDSSQINLGEPIIDRNIIEDWQNGIYLEDVDGATVTNNLIWHNNEGIYLDGCDNIQILYNDILKNPGAASGVHLDVDCGANTTINYNNIVANSSFQYGVDNRSGNVIDAENNWWGDPSGPEHTPVLPCTDCKPPSEGGWNCDVCDKNPDGLGDKVSDDVDYCPWLTQQSHVTIYEETTTATATGTASVQTGGGAVTDLEAVDESTLPTAGKPDLGFPHGFFSFNIIGLTPGQTVVVTITLPANVPVGTEYWKYHPGEGGWIQIPMGSDNGDNIITITLVDGGLGDDDGLANGVIVDQGGPGFVTPPAPVPAPPPAPPLVPEVEEPVKPARFLTSNLYIVPTEVKPNQGVDILLDVTNYGDNRGGYGAILSINGEVEYSQAVYLSPGQTERVVFTVYRATPGAYEVSLGGYGGWFTVVETGYTVAETPAEPSGGLGTPAIIAIVLGSVGVGIAIFFATRRRQY